MRLFTSDSFNFFFPEEGGGRTLAVSGLLSSELMSVNICSRRVCCQFLAGTGSCCSRDGVASGRAIIRDIENKTVLEIF